jgi:hypothetical protein
MNALALTDYDKNYRFPVEIIRRGQEVPSEAHEAMPIRPTPGDGPDAHKLTMPA